MSRWSTCRSRSRGVPELHIAGHLHGRHAQTAPNLAAREPPSIGTPRSASPRASRITAQQQPEPVFVLRQSQPGRPHTCEGPSPRPRRLGDDGGSRLPRTLSQLGQFVACPRSSDLVRTNSKSDAPPRRTRHRKQSASLLVHLLVAHAQGSRQPPKDWHAAMVIYTVNCKAQGRPVPCNPPPKISSTNPAPRVLGPTSRPSMPGSWLASNSGLFASSLRSRSIEACGPPSQLGASAAGFLWMRSHSVRPVPFL